MIRLAAVGASLSLAACEAIADFFIGDLGPDDPATEPYLVISDPVVATSRTTTALEVNIGALLVDVQAGGVPTGKAFLAFRVAGGYAWSLESAGAGAGCLELPEDGTNNLPGRILPLAVEATETSPILMVGLYTPVPGADAETCTDAGSNVECGAPAQETQAADAAPDAQDASTTATDTASLRAVLDRLCPGTTFRAAKARFLEPVRVVDAGSATPSDTGTDVATDVAADVRIDAPADAVADVRSD